MSSYKARGLCCQQKKKKAAVNTEGSSQSWGRGCELKCLPTPLSAAFICSGVQRGRITKSGSTLESEI